MFHVLFNFTFLNSQLYEQEATKGHIRLCHHQQQENMGRHLPSFDLQPGKKAHPLQDSAYHLDHQARCSSLNVEWNY